jgi:hypothetical protein
MSPTAIPGNLILQSPTASKLILVNDQRNPAGDAQITYGITSTGGVFNLRSTGTVDYEVEWGDGTVERSTSNALAHTYAAGSYVLKIRTAQQYRPLFNNSTDEDQITSVALVSDLDVGSILANAWFGGNNITSFDAAFGVTTGVTNFSFAWYACSSLTDFPEIDTSSGTSFIETWRRCNQLTSFPLIDVSSGTTFASAWRDCTGLTNFPANFFDSWTATPVNSCFFNTWLNCSSLTATSVENILNSIDTSGRSAPASGVDITISYNASSGTPNISTAVSNLKSRGWTITLNGVPQ